MENPQTQKYKQEYIQELMQLAIDTAKTGYEQFEVAVGCVFAEVNSDLSYKVITKSHNLTNLTQNATMHCEIICIKKMQEQLGIKDGKNITLYVTCEPCIMCGYALNIFGIKNVFYGCGNDKFGGNGSILPLNNGQFGYPQYESYGGYMENECAEILKSFYERGNQSLEEDQRHRKNKNKDQQQNQQQQQQQTFKQKD